MTAIKPGAVFGKEGETTGFWTDVEEFVVECTMAQGASRSDHLRALLTYGTNEELSTTKEGTNATSISKGRGIDVNAHSS